MSITGVVKPAAKRLPGMHRETVHMSQRSLVDVSFFAEGRKLPLVIQPDVESLDLFEWARQNREYLDKALIDNGGILFRGFKIGSQAAFERFLPAVSTQLLNYIEGSTPRSHLSDKVYTSTEFPALQSIMLHNELNYVTTWPQRIWFCCLTAAETGGETPIADVRRVYQRIDAEIIEKFREIILVPRQQMVGQERRSIELSHVDQQ